MWFVHREREALQNCLFLLYSILSIKVLVRDCAMQCFYSFTGSSTLLFERSIEKEDAEATEQNTWTKKVKEKHIVKRESILSLLFHWFPFSFSAFITLSLQFSTHLAHYWIANVHSLLLCSQWEAECVIISVKFVDRFEHKCCQDTNITWVSEKQRRQQEADRTNERLQHTHKRWHE